MESQNLKQRVRDEPTADRNTTDDDDDKSRKEKRRAMARRGLRSLVVAVTLPILLTVANIYAFGSRSRQSLWALHVASLFSSILMGLSAWLVWADGGFHRKPIGLLLYTVAFALSLAWDPIVVRAGSSRVGLVVCLGIFGSLVGCSWIFGSVNHVAGHLIKPCLAWAVFLTVVNLKFYNEPLLMGG